MRNLFSKSFLCFGLVLQLVEVLIQLVQLTLGELLSCKRYSIVKLIIKRVVSHVKRGHHHIISSASAHKTVTLLRLHTNKVLSED